VVGIELFDADTVLLFPIHPSLNPLRICS